MSEIYSSCTSDKDIEDSNDATSDWITAVFLFGILGSYLFLHIWENILLKLGK